MRTLHQVRRGHDLPCNPGCIERVHMEFAVPDLCPDFFWNPLPKRRQILLRRLKNETASIAQTREHVAVLERVHVIHQNRVHDVELLMEADVLGTDRQEVSRRKSLLLSSVFRERLDLHIE